MPTKEQQEHILVCLSSSPSNAKLIETAAKMSTAFGGAFTALYVKTSDKISVEDAKRLQYNMDYAEHFGAKVTTVYGEDVSYQIAEFARLSRVSKIVIGRSSMLRRRMLSKQTLPEKLTAIVPNMEVYIIPDIAAETKYKTRKPAFSKRIAPSWKDLLITVLILAVATGIGILIWKCGLSDANIIMVYILGVLLTTFFTKSYVCSVIGSLVSVLIFNLLFVEPRQSFGVENDVTYFTLAIMLIASLITGTLAKRLQNNAKQSAQSAYRTKVLFDTNQLLQKEQSDIDALNIVASQLNRLLDRDVVAYPVKDGQLSSGQIFTSSPEKENKFVDFECVSKWLAKQRNETEHSPLIAEEQIHFAVNIGGKIYGVVGVFIGNKPLDTLENSILQSIIGECALAIDNIRNAEEKKTADVLAKQEQLRANLLRTISHDLRTPLTAISGNADYLLMSYDKLDDETRTQVFVDIYDEAIWLTNLVENLLSITRIEGDNVNLNLNCELVDEIIEEAISRTRHRCKKHIVTSNLQDKLLVVKVNARLIVQVIINLIDNVIKYTPAGTRITISAQANENMVEFSVSDDGQGVADQLKERVFDMFYTGDKTSVDSHRSLGLGLALCKSIVNAHGGQIRLSDNKPRGSVFSFTVPLGEIVINE